jgi:iron complex outermembrane receptor protein
MAAVTKRPNSVLLVVSTLALAMLAAPAPALADARTEARRHFKAGMALISKGNYAQGIKELEKANEILPHPNVTFNIARAHAEAGNLEQAIAAYRRYLASDPPDRAEVTQVTQQLQEKFDKQKTSATSTESARLHFKSGMDLISKGKFDDGIKELEKANEIVPHPNITFNIARAHAEAGNLEKAIAAYKSYLSGNPADKKQVESIVAQLEERLAKQRAAAPVQPVDPGRPVEPGEPADPGRPVEPGDPGSLPLDPKVTPAAKDQGLTKPGEGTNAKAIVGSARTEDVYQETVITASRGAQSPLDSPNSTTIITRQDIRLSGITRIPELLRRAAGMDVMQITGGDSNVSIRGFNGRLSNKVLVLVNGRTINNDILGATFWETISIDVDQVERIEVVRGPGSALYGADAFQGVVNIITIAPGEGRGGARVGYGDSMDAYGSIWVAGREGDFAYRASAGYTRHPRWTREVGERRVDLELADTDQDLATQNFRVDVRASQRLGEGKELLVGGGFARADLEFYGVGPFNDFALKADTSDVTAAFRSEHINVRAYYSRLSVEASANHDYYGRTRNPTEPVQNSVDGEVEFVDQFVFPAALKHDMHVGITYRLKDIEWNYLLDNPPVEHHGAVYLQDSIKIGEYFTVVASGRLDYVPYLERVIASPRGSVIIKPTPQQAIRVSGSTAFRKPTLLESYLELPVQLQLPGVEIISASDRLDTPGTIVEPEQIVTGEASYLNQQSDLFEFELTGYYNRVSQLIALADPTVASLSNKQGGLGGLNPETGRYTVAFGSWENQCDTYHVVGGELGARVYPIEGLDVFANYAVNVSQQEKPDTCPLPEDRRTSRHKVNAGVQVRTKAGVNGEVSVHYQSPQIWVEQVTTPTSIEPQAFNLDAYTLLNARIGYRFYKDRAEVSGTIFNALSGVGGDAPQMHPFGNRIGRRVMGFISYSL